MKPLFFTGLFLGIFSVSHPQAAKLNIGMTEKIIQIDFESSGCFSSRSAGITVFKTGDITFAELSTNKRRHLVVTLNALQINEVDKFIKTFRSVNGAGGCTTVDKYTVYYDNQTMKKTDASCGWSGFDILQKALFTNN